MKSPVRLKHVHAQLAEKRRNQILSAAVELFSSHGFYETEMEDISSTAGVSKGTIYNYFESKKALFIAAIEWGVHRLISRIKDTTASIEDPVARIEEAMRIYIDFFHTNKSLYRILFVHRSTFRDQIETRFQRKYLGHLYIFEDMLRYGIDRGMFKVVDVHTVSFALTGILHSLYHKWLMLGEDSNMAADVEQITEIVLHGLVSRDLHADPEPRTGDPTGSYSQGGRS